MPETPEQTDWTVAIVAAVTLGVAGVIAMFFTKLKQAVEVVADLVIGRIKRGGSADWDRSLSFLAEFNAILHQADSVENVERVLVFIGHNGGGLPSKDSKYTIRSQIGWDLQPDGRRVYNENFRFNLVVDQHYCDMLHRVHERGRVVLTVADMPESMLRSIYEDEGVVQSAVYQLRHDRRRNRFGYVSVASKSRAFTAGELSRLDVVVARLRSALNEISPQD